MVLFSGKTCRNQPSWIGINAKKGWAWGCCRDSEHPEAHTFDHFDPIRWIWWFAHGQRWPSPPSSGCPWLFWAGIGGWVLRKWGSFPGSRWIGEYVYSRYHLMGFGLLGQFFSVFFSSSNGESESIMYCRDLYRVCLFLVCSRPSGVCSDPRASSITTHTHHRLRGSTTLTS